MTNEETTEFLLSLERERQREIETSYNRGLELNKTISMWRLLQPLYGVIKHTSGLSMFTLSDGKHYIAYNYQKKEFELYNDDLFVSDLPVNTSSVFFLKGYLIGKGLI